MIVCRGLLYSSRGRELTADGLFSHFSVYRCEGEELKKKQRQRGAFDLYAELRGRTTPYHCVPPFCSSLFRQHSAFLFFFLVSPRWCRPLIPGSQLE